MNEVQAVEVTFLYPSYKVPKLYVNFLTILYHQPLCDPYLPTLGGPRFTSGSAVAGENVPLESRRPRA